MSLLLTEFYSVFDRRKTRRCLRRLQFSRQTITGSRHGSGLTLDKNAIAGCRDTSQRTVKPKANNIVYEFYTSLNVKHLMIKNLTAGLSKNFLFIISLH